MDIYLKCQFVKRTFRQSLKRPSDSYEHLIRELNTEQAKRLENVSDIWKIPIASGAEKQSCEKTLIIMKKKIIMFLAPEE